LESWAEANGSSGVGSAEALVGEWGAVESGAGLDIEGLFENCGCITRVELIDDEGDDAAELSGGVGRKDFDAGSQSEFCGEPIGLADELLVTLVECLLGEFCGGEQTGDGGEVGGAAFKAVGGLERLFEREAVGTGAAADEWLDEV
jgi:hypothetical protein